MSRKANARSLGQDLMKGEGGIPADGLGPGVRTRETYQASKRAANAQVAGGGGGGWKAHNEKMAANRAKLTNINGLANNLHAHAYDGGTESGAGATGTSIFDPVLTELCYRWFCPPGGSILDPFAGGSVRGIVASHLGRKYTGIDLRAEQLEANRAQLKICKKPAPKWVLGDSRDLAKLLPADEQFDFVFSCPPYWNLEVYSEDERDLSTMGSNEFFAAQAEIIRAACARLKNNRFAGWIVGDVRDAKGMYVNLPGRSVEAFEAAGLRLYNDAILITAAGSLPIRAGKQFEASRKLGHTHQSVLLFAKGDPVLATKAIGPVEFGDVAAFSEVAEGDQLSQFGKVL